jgi:hypothetical protein
MSRLKRRFDGGGERRRNTGGFPILARRSEYRPRDGNAQLETAVDRIDFIPIGRAPRRLPDDLTELVAGNMASEFFGCRTGAAARENVERLADHGAQARQRAHHRRSFAAPVKGDQRLVGLDEVADELMDRAAGAAAIAPEVNNDRVAALEERHRGIDRGLAFRADPIEARKLEIADVAGQHPKLAHPMIFPPRRLHHARGRSTPLVRRRLRLLHRMRCNRLRIIFEVEVMVAPDPRQIFVDALREQSGLADLVAPGTQSFCERGIEGRPLLGQHIFFANDASHFGDDRRRIEAGLRGGRRRSLSNRGHSHGFSNMWDKGNDKRPHS